jgi:hypothetical protein
MPIEQTSYTYHLPLLNLHTFKHRTYQMYQVDDDLLHSHQPCESNHSACGAFDSAEEEGSHFSATL